MADVLNFRSDPALTAALTAEATRQGVTVSDVIRAPLQAAYVRDRPSYGSGSQYSLVRDAWAVVCGRGPAEGADQRLDQLRADVATGRAEFAVTTGNASQAIPPGYSPLVADQSVDRPLLGLATVLPLASPVPFGVPGTATATGTGPHIEGANPAGGALALAGGTVAPTGVSGVFELSRELADAANPAIDALALATMRESYNQQTEALIAAELAAVTAGAIANGLVPSGAQAATTTAATVAADVPKLLARMVRLRRRRPQAAVSTAATTFAEALAALDQSTGDADALWRPMGVPLNLSADLASTVGATAVVAVSPASVWAWESPTREFTWEQVQGPATLKLSLFGYFAAKVLRPVGVAALRAA